MNRNNLIAVQDDIQNMEKETQTEPHQLQHQHGLGGLQQIEEEQVEEGEGRERRERRTNHITIRPTSSSLGETVRNDATNSNANAMERKTSMLYDIGYDDDNDDDNMKSVIRIQLSFELEKVYGKKGIIRKGRASPYIVITSTTSSSSSSNTDSDLDAQVIYGRTET